jgi:ABC-type transporter Mla subunit MlaD
MAPKTYPQQIADLKQEKLALLDEIERLRLEIKSFDSIKEQNTNLQGLLAEQAKDTNQSNVGLEAKFRDAVQRAESEAAHARRVVDENTRLAHINGQLHNQVENAEHRLAGIGNQDTKIQELTHRLSVLSTQQTNRERQLTDLVREKETEIDGMANELRTLRLQTRSHPNQLAQLQQDTERQVSEAREKVRAFEEYNNKLFAENRDLRHVIKQYANVVDNLPDTRQQLVNILSRVKQDKD